MPKLGLAKAGHSFDSDIDLNCRDNPALEDAFALPVVLRE